MELERTLDITIRLSGKKDEKPVLVFEIKELETSDHVTIQDTEIHDTINRIGNEIYSWSELMKDELMEELERG